VSGHAAPHLPSSPLSLAALGWREERHDLNGKACLNAQDLYTLTCGGAFSFDATNSVDSAAADHVADDIACIFDSDDEAEAFAAVLPALVVEKRPPISVSNMSCDSELNAGASAPAAAASAVAPVSPSVVSEEDDDGAFFASLAADLADEPAATAEDSPAGDAGPTAELPAAPACP